MKKTNIIYIILVLLIAVSIVGCESNSREIECNQNWTGLTTDNDICNGEEWITKEEWSKTSTQLNQSYWNGYNQAIKLMADNEKYPSWNENKIVIMGKEQVCSS